MITHSAKEFYQKNKDCHWTKEPIPDQFITDIERADWILNKSNFGWIELDLNIDLEHWKNEAVSASAQFVKHRENDSNGWLSACIHGIDVSYTGSWNTYGYVDEKSVPYHWTSLSNNTPSIKTFWNDTFPSDNYRRIRFMSLEPNGVIEPHSDRPGRLPGEEEFDALQFGVPINIAVIHPEDCFMTLEGYGVVPFREGRAFIVNIRNFHSVINFSNNPRIHVIGHSRGYGNKLQEFASLVVRSYNKMQSFN